MKGKALRHLQQERPDLYAELRRSGQLEEDLNYTARRAAQMQERIEEELRAKNPAPENFLERAQQLNWIRSTAYELVKGELLPPTRTVQPKK